MNKRVKFSLQAGIVTAAILAVSATARAQQHPQATGLLRTFFNFLARVIRHPHG